MFGVKSGACSIEHQPFSFCWALVLLSWSVNNETKRCDRAQAPGVSVCDISPTVAVQDVDLIFYNCLLYNGNRSEVGMYGERLGELWKHQWATSGLSGVITH
jgi:hypothetical protein